MTEITPYTSPSTATSGPDTETINALTGFTDALTRHVLATRPAPPSMPAQGPSTAPEPFAVRVQTPGTVGAGPRRVERLYVKSDVFFFSFASTVLAGALSTALTGDLAPLALVVLGIVGAGGSLAASIKDQDRRGPRAKHGIDRHGNPITEA